jgi:flavin-dependent dehydrogenase
MVSAPGQAMASDRGRPVIVGSSMTGLMISLSLSRAGVAHVLLGGGPPADVPRLGESLNEPAAPELYRLFGKEWPDLFVKKNHISLFNGSYVTSIHIGNPNRRLAQVAETVIRDGQVRLPKARTILTHVDRVEFDKRLYAKVRAESCCEFRETLVSRVVHDAPSDVITRLELTDGTSLENPQYVFDATGPRGLVAEAAGVPRAPMSTPQRVVWTHLRRQELDSRPRLWWLFGTNLVRLRQETDGIEGIAWVIPIATTLSLGLSVDAATAPDETYDDEALLELLVAACERRGLAVRSIYPEAWKSCGVRNQYYIRKRAFGANWLLAGAAFATVWFPTSSGIWTTTCAAGLAPRLLDDPHGAGTEYERLMRKLLPFHDLQEQMVHGPAFESVGDCLAFWARWLSFIPARLAAYFRIVNGADKRRWRLGVLDSATKRFQRHPRTQMLLWGLIPARGTYQPDLSKQADVYPSYFKTGRHRLRNVLGGLSRLFTIKRYDRVTLGRETADAVRNGKPGPLEVSGVSGADLASRPSGIPR